MYLQASLKASTLSILVVLLSHCAMPVDSAWTPEWQAHIGCVKSMPVITNSGAYQEPSGVDTSKADLISSRVYMASAGDNLLGLAGGLVSSGIARGQQNDFVEKSGSHFGVLAGYFDEGLNRSIGTAQAQALSVTTNKDKPGSPPSSILRTNILRCGFVRSGLGADNQVLLTPTLQIHSAVLSNDLKKAFMTKIVRIDLADEGFKHTAEEYARSVALKQSTQQAMAAKVGRVLTETLRAKMGATQGAH